VAGFSGAPRSGLARNTTDSLPLSLREFRNAVAKYKEIPVHITYDKQLRRRQSGEQFFSSRCRGTALLSTVRGARQVPIAKRSAAPENRHLFGVLAQLVQRLNGSARPQPFVQARTLRPSNGLSRTVRQPVAGFLLAAEWTNAASSGLARYSAGG
jgi:hypothetical protein